MFKKDGNGKTIVDSKPYIDNWRKVRNSLGMLASDSLITGDINIIVEGLTEQIYLPELLRKYTKIDVDMINVINAGGAGKIRYVIPYLKNLPSKIMAVVDGDNQGDQQLTILIEILGEKNVFSLTKKEDRDKDIAFEDLFDDELIYKAVINEYQLMLSFEEINEMKNKKENKKKCWAKFYEEVLKQQDILNKDYEINKIDLCRHLVNQIGCLPNPLSSLVNRINELLEANT